MLEDPFLIGKYQAPTPFAYGSMRRARTFDIGLAALDNESLDEESPAAKANRKFSNDDLSMVHSRRRSVKVEVPWMTYEEMAANEAGDNPVTTAGPAPRKFPWMNCEANQVSMSPVLEGRCSGTREAGYSQEDLAQLLERRRSTFDDHRKSTNHSIDEMFDDFVNRCSLHTLEEIEGIFQEQNGTNNVAPPEGGRSMLKLENDQEGALVSLEEQFGGMFGEAMDNSMAASNSVVDSHGTKGTSLEAKASAVALPSAQAAAGHVLYACGYCGERKESASCGKDGRVRIRCKCGGRYADGQNRMHAHWKVVLTDTCSD